MARRKHAKASRDAAACRKERRRLDAQLPVWMRTLRRARLAVAGMQRMIRASMRAAAASRRCAHRRPVQASHGLKATRAALVAVRKRQMYAAMAILDTKDALALAAAGDPQAEVYRELLAVVNQWWIDVSVELAYAELEVVTGQKEVRDGLESGELVPERPGRRRRPRVTVAPKPPPVRAFLCTRWARVVDRIASLLRRRRRTPRPAALRVPQRSILGRAPPVSLVCTL